MTDHRARCFALVALASLLMSAPALAGPATWRDGLETVRLIDERAGRIAVIVVGAGAQRGLADATRAVRDAYKASGAASLVMDDQALGSIAGLSDAAIVKRARDLPVTHVAIVRMYGDRAVIAVYDRWGAPQRSVTIRPMSRADMETAVTNQVLQRYPWLTRLAEHRSIAQKFARLTLAERAAMRLSDRRRALPDPAATIVSRKRARRERRRRAVAKQIKSHRAKIKRLSAPISISIEPLLRDGFTTRSTRSTQAMRASERAGRVALARELAAKPAVLRMHRHGLNRAFPWSLGVYANGSWIACEPDGIHLDALIEPQGAITTGYLWRTEVYLHAVIAHGTASMQAMVDRRPELAAILLDQFINRMDEAALSQRLVQEHELMVRELAAERRRVASQMQGSAAATLAPLLIVGTLFVADGPVDLMLTIMPVHKLGKAGKLGRQLLKSDRRRRPAKWMREFGDAVDNSREMNQFLRLAKTLKPADVKALKTIHDRVPSTAVAGELMVRHVNGKANVRWIAQQLKDGKFDGEFVRRFTYYPAGPSWKVLEKVVKRKPVDEEQRKALVRHVKGFLGEEAAARIAHSTAFVKKFFRSDRRGLKVRRGVEYNKQRGSMDVVVLREGDVVFGEVKNWSAKKWKNSAARAETLEQLGRHDGGEAQILKEVSRRKSNVKDKLLMVEKTGFDGLTKADKKAFGAELDERGWKIFKIPSDQIESFGTFITRIR